MNNRFENTQFHSPGREHAPDIDTLLNYESRTQQGWEQQRSSAAEVGSAVGDFSRRFEAAHQQLEAGVQEGRISREQRDRVLQQMSGVLDTYLPDSERGLNGATVREKANGATFGRVREAGRLIGQATGALLEAPGKAVDKFFGGMFRAGRTSLGELTRMGTEPLRNISTAVEDSATRLSNAGFKVAKAGIDSVGHAVATAGEKTGEGIGKLISHVGEGTGNAIEAVVKKTGQGVGEGTGRAVGGAVGGVITGFRAAMGQ